MIKFIQFAYQRPGKS